KSRSLIHSCRAGLMQLFTGANNQLNNPHFSKLMYYFNKVKAGFSALFPPVFLRIMKLTVILVVLAVTQLFAKGYSQDINLDVRDMPLEAVFSLIERQSGYVFFYDNQLVKDRRLTIKVEKSSIDEILNNSFKNLPLEFTIVKGKNIVVKQKVRIEASFVTPITKQQLIRGKVTNINGEPLIGVTVNEKTFNSSTMTDSDGNFAISITQGNTLVCSMIGYTAKELTMQPNGPLSVIMEEDNQGLEDVVV